MTFLIGGFSVQQYHAFLNPTPQNQNEKSNHWVSQFNCTVYSILVVFINRLAYFILHKCSAYPNNAFLFQKFKTHQFITIKTEEQYKIAYELFKEFQQCAFQCPELKLSEINRIGRELEIVEQNIKKGVKGSDSDKLTNTPGIEYALQTLKEKEKTRQLYLAKDIDDDEILDPDVDNKALTETLIKNTGSNNEKQDVELRAKKEKKDSKKSASSKVEKKPSEARKKRKKDIIYIKFPAPVEAILNQPFPLEKEASLNDLYQRKDGDVLYRHNLKVLLGYENTLHEVGGLSEKVSFGEYLKKADGAFQKVWEEAVKESEAMHAKFKTAFPAQPVKLMDNGEVVCTAQQLAWVRQTISHHFPAIYHLAFDAPSLKIYQSSKMAALARSILVGSDAKTKEILSPCFIRLIETVDKSTPPFEAQSLLQAGSSFIDTYLISEQKEGEDLKQILEVLIRDYVEEWLEQPGAILQFEGATIRGGQREDAIPASHWVRHMRDHYTQKLLLMTKEELRDEIKNLTNNTLLRKIKEKYANEIKNEDWEKSCFPKSLIKEMFMQQFQRVNKSVSLHFAICETINCTSFREQKDIQTLAERAECGTELIEPLIRIRILSMIACLGTDLVESTLSGMDQRARTMYDPAVCKTVKDRALDCQIDGERILSFNNHFDRFNMILNLKFTDPYTLHSVAQGQTTLSVSSIFGSNKEKVKINNVNLQHLRFGLHASDAQREYLLAQIEPNTLINNIRILLSEIDNLELVKKAKEYQQAKEKYSSTWLSWTRKKSSFDSMRYRHFDQDGKHLDEVIDKARKLVTYLNAEQMLLFTDQLNSTQIAHFEEHSKKIHHLIDKTLNALEEIYSIKNNEQKEIQNKIKEIRSLLAVKKEDVGVIDSDAEESFQLTPDEEDYWD